MNKLPMSVVCMVTTFTKLPPTGALHKQVISNFRRRKLNSICYPFYTCANDNSPNTRHSVIGLKNDLVVMKRSRIVTKKLTHRTVFRVPNRCHSRPMDAFGFSVLSIGVHRIAIITFLWSIRAFTRTVHTILCC